MFLSLYRIYSFITRRHHSHSQTDRQRGSRPSIVSGIAGGSTDQRRGSTTSTGSTETSSGAAGGIQQQMEQTAAHIKGLIRRASQAGADDVSGVRQSNSSNAPPDTGDKPLTGQSEEDTMKNLRKTFAGIFGDM